MYLERRLMFFHMALNSFVCYTVKHLGKEV